jgi:thiamine-phosphate pyrophosphorylase
MVIGGITLENGKQLLDAGADMLAVCHSLFAADDITAQAKKFTELKN